MRRALFYLFLFFPLMGHAHFDVASCAALVGPLDERDLPVIGELNARPVHVVWRGQELKMERREAAILKVIISHPIATYGEIARQVWGRESIAITAIQSAVKGIRAKLRQVEPVVPAIINEIGVGFRWNFAGEMPGAPELSPRKQKRYKQPKFNLQLAPLLQLPDARLKWDRNSDPFAPPEVVGAVQGTVQIKWYGQVFPLSRIEFLVLQALTQYFPALFSDIGSHVWNDPSKPVPTIIDAVTSLRVKLRAIAPQHTAILRVPQMGYQWNWGHEPKLALQFTLKPDFPSHLELDPLTNFVKWKGRVFPLFPAEFMALDTLVWPEESLLVSKQELISQAYGPNSNKSAFDLIKSLNGSFREVDPEFAGIERVSEGGYWSYLWKEHPVPSYEVFGGRLRVGKSVPNVWLDDQLIKVQPREYDLLKTLSRLGSINLLSFPEYSSVAANVNMRFNRGLGGQPLLVRQGDRLRFAVPAR